MGAGVAVVAVQAVERVAAALGNVTTVVGTGILVIAKCLGGNANSFKTKGCASFGTRVAVIAGLAIGHAVNLAEMLRIALGDDARRRRIVRHCAIAIDRTGLRW